MIGMLVWIDLFLLDFVCEPIMQILYRRTRKDNLHMANIFFKGFNTLLMLWGGYLIFFQKVYFVGLCIIFMLIFSIIGMSENFWKLIVGNKRIRSPYQRDISKIQTYIYHYGNNPLRLSQSRARIRNIFFLIFILFVQSASSSIYSMEWNCFLKYIVLYSIFYITFLYVRACNVYFVTTDLESI